MLEGKEFGFSLTTAEEMEESGNGEFEVKFITLFFGARIAVLGAVRSSTFRLSSKSMVNHELRTVSRRADAAGFLSDGFWQAIGPASRARQR